MRGAQEPERQTLFYSLQLHSDRLNMNFYMFNFNSQNSQIHLKDHTHFNTQAKKYYPIVHSSQVHLGQGEEKTRRVLIGGSRSGPAFWAGLQGSFSAYIWLSSQQPLECEKLNIFCAQFLALIKNLRQWKKVSLNNLLNVFTCSKFCKMSAK